MIKIKQGKIKGVCEIYIAHQRYPPEKIASIFHKDPSNPCSVTIVIAPTEFAKPRVEPLNDFRIEEIEVSPTRQTVCVELEKQAE